MKPLGPRGEGNQGAMIAIVLLVIALIAVFFLWQRDRESVDLNVDVGASTQSPAVLLIA